MFRAVKVALLLVAVTLVSAFFPAPPASDVTPMQLMFVMKEVKPGIERLGIMWNKDAHDEATLTKIRRASTSLKVQIFLAEVGGLNDLAPQFRTLTRKHKIQLSTVKEILRGVLDA